MKPDAPDDAVATEQLLAAYADDPRALSVAERARVAEARVRGLMNEVREHQRYSKMWKKKFDDLEKKQAKATTKALQPAPAEVA